MSGCSVFPEADAVHVHALTRAALVLLLVTAAGNVIGLGIQWLAVGGFEGEEVLRAVGI